MTQRSDLYLKLVELSGLSAIFADRTLERALSRAGVDPADLQPRHLARVAPALEEALAVYLEPEALEQAMERIRALIPEGSAPRIISLAGDEEEEEDERTLPERVAQAFAKVGKRSE